MTSENLSEVKDAALRLRLWLELEREPPKTPGVHRFISNADLEAVVNFVLKDERIGR